MRVLTYCVIAAPGAAQALRQGFAGHITFSNLEDVIKLEKNCNNIKYFISNNKDNNNNSINLRNSITSTTNFLLVIFKNYKKTYR